jgi:hypothetical protein
MDPNFWEPNGGNLTLCSCDVPQVQGNWGGTAVENGPCNACQCYDIVIDNRDPQVSENGVVMIFYQCCDGTFINEPLVASETRCALNIMGLFIVSRGVYIPPFFGSTYSVGQGNCNPCSSCGTQC